ncbi:Viral A-type inclusion protein repeat containing protein [Planoprotostelium fungivorum]|uniref:Viral A-type inclusion protein repeat containing protein n=1 Tax=Planoprotostelium fungivorum TaxID=1890364 RepID=A0A2P6N033_9EUKA|nr:Viral A-type inclusion protein repeat containing protein [Planoprotostelium fungivorum]
MSSTSNTATDPSSTSTGRVPWWQKAEQRMKEESKEKPKTEELLNIGSVTELLVSRGDGVEISKLSRPVAQLGTSDIEKLLKECANGTELFTLLKKLKAENKMNLRLWALCVPLCPLDQLIEDQMHELQQLMGPLKQDEMIITAIVREHAKQSNSIQVEKIAMEYLLGNPGRLTEKFFLNTLWGFRDNDLSKVTMWMDIARTLGKLNPHIFRFGISILTSGREEGREQLKIWLRGAELHKLIELMDDELIVNIVRFLLLVDELPTIERWIDRMDPSSTLTPLLETMVADHVMGQDEEKYMYWMDRIRKRGKIVNPTARMMMKDNNMVISPKFCGASHKEVFECSQSSPSKACLLSGITRSWFPTLLRPPNNSTTLTPNPRTIYHDVFCEDLNTRQSARLSVRLDVDALYTRIASLEAYVAELEGLTNVRADLSSLFQENLNSLREQLEESQREKEESSTELVDLREKIAELRLQKDKSDKQRKELEEYIKEAEVLELHSTMNRLETELETANEENTELRQQVKELTEEKEKLRNNCDSVTERYIALQDQRSRDIDERRIAESNLADHVKWIKELEVQLQTVQVETEKGCIESTRSPGKSSPRFKQVKRRFINSVSPLIKRKGNK